jgi:zinc/manganese transport system substrate-binding protein
VKLARLALLVAPVLALVAPSQAAARLRVVTTTEGLAALAREVGGDRVEVESLSRGIQDPHFVDPNPILAVKLRRADLLIDNGLDLEIGWLPPLVNQSRNPDIQPTGSRRLIAANFVHVRDVPVGPVDRSMGDLHPAGNPHFISDPRPAEAIAAGVAAKLSELDPAGAAAYSARLADFKRRIDADLVRARGVKAILVENYYDPKFAQAVARYTAAKVVLIPGDVGGEPGLDTYEKYVDRLVHLLVGALR